MSINKVILIGNVGCDPQIRYIDTRPIASFSFATTERGRKGADGSDLPDRTEWHQLVMWDKGAEFAEKYIRKGTRMYVEGKLRYRMWEDRNTIKHRVAEIYVDVYELLSR